MPRSLPTRCPWLDLSKPDYVAYHDQEWGVPVYEDQTIFEFLTLESAQAGLSWYTVLKKRPHYRKAFADFRVDRVARFSDQDVERLLQNPGLIRNRLKITAAINNARRFQEDPVRVRFVRRLRVAVRGRASQGQSIFNDSPTTRPRVLNPTR